MPPKADLLIDVPGCDGLGSPPHREFSVYLSRMSGESVMRSTLKIVAAMAGVVLTGLFGLDRTRAGRRPGGNETYQVLAGRLARHRRWAPVRGLLLPDRGAGLPARRCRKAAVNTSRLAGSATFYHPDAPGRPWFSRPLHPEPATAGQVPASLDLTIGLAKAPQKGATVAFEIVGLGGHDRRHGDVQSPARVHHHDGPAADRAPRRGRVGSSLYLRPGILWIRLLRLPGA